MKRLFFAWGLLIAISLSGCMSSAYRVATLKYWSFQYNEGTNDYSILFGLFDKNGNPVSAEANVDIRIVNEENEEVYAETLPVSANDYGYCTNQIIGEQYLTIVRIPASKIIPGKASNGKVFLTVYQENTFRFDEVNCEAMHCLPIEDIQVSFDAFPLDLKVTDYMGNTASMIQIQNATYTVDKEFTPKLTVTIFGEKISGNSNSAYDKISYKLYDSDGYMVKSGDIYLHSLRAGDKFKDDSVVIYDITPGSSYTFQLSEYNR